MQNIRKLLAFNKFIFGPFAGLSGGNLGRIDDQFVFGKERVPLELVEPLVAFERGE